MNQLYVDEEHRHHGAVVYFSDLMMPYVIALGLDLPPDVKVCGLFPRPEALGYGVVLTGPDLPAVADGAVLPSVMATVYSDHREGEEHPEIVQIKVDPYRPGDGSVVNIRKVDNDAE